MNYSYLPYLFCLVLLTCTPGYGQLAANLNLTDPNTRELRHSFPIAASPSDRIGLNQSRRGFTVQTTGEAGKWGVGIRFIAQATTFRYRQDIPTLPALLDYLKISSPYYFRVRTAQGLGVTYQALPRLRLGSDLLLSLQGGGYQPRKTNLTYLTLPVWIGYATRADRKVGFCIQSGIQFSYLLAGRIRYGDRTSISVRDQLSTISWGVPVALGACVRLNRTHMTAQLYVYSDFTTLARTNIRFGVYNYVYPGLRITLDQTIPVFKSGIQTKNN